MLSRSKHTEPSGSLPAAQAPQPDDFVEWKISDCVGLARARDTGATFFVQHVAARFASTDVCRHDLHIELPSDGGKFEEARLDPAIRKKILSYMAFGARDERFDCHHFVQYLHGVPYGETEEGFSRTYWKKPRLVEPGEKLAPGAIVTLCAYEPPSGDSGPALIPRHSAILLGGDLYLSVFGAGGPLIVASLRQLARGFHGDLCIVREPRAHAR